MSGHYFPPEIVEDILERLPVKSLVRFTSVCKAWNSLITSQTFISHHLNRSIQALNGGNNSRSLFLHLKRNPFHHYEDSYLIYSSNQQQSSDHHLSVEKRFPLSHLFQPSCSLFASTCNGLICCADYYPSDSANIFIWNPLLRKYVVLPKPNIITSNKRDSHRYGNYDIFYGFGFFYDRYDICYGFGFDSSNNDYKVVRLVMKNFSPHAEVYSLVSHSWRSIDVTVPRFYLYPKSHERIRQVFVNGAVHWFVLRHRSNFKGAFILSFDVTEETFRKIPLPKQATKKESDMTNLIAVEGGHSLAVMNVRCIKSGEWVCNVWVMKEYGIAESWTQIFQCNQSLYGGISRILALTSSGKLVINLICGFIVLVDTSKELVEHLRREQYCEAYAGTYVESLFFINKEPDLLSF